MQRVVSIVNEIAELYNRNFEILEAALPSSALREMESLLSRMVLKYVFLSCEAGGDEIALLKNLRNLLEVLVRLLNYS